MTILRCQNEDCSKVLNRNDFEILEDDDGDLLIFCLDCGSLSWPLSRVVSSSDLQSKSASISLGV